MFRLSVRHVHVTCYHRLFSIKSDRQLLNIPRWGPVPLSSAWILSRYQLLVPVCPIVNTMGNLLAFIRQFKDGGLDNIDEKYQIFLDFENEDRDLDDLKGEEKQFAEKVEEKLKSSLEFLTFLQEYGGGGRKIIVEASANVADLELQNNAWAEVVPLVSKLQMLKRITESLNQEVRLEYYIGTRY